MKNNIGERLLFIDTETGGIDPNKHTLLSIGLAVWDSSGKVLGSKEFYVKHKDYVFTIESQKINKFDRFFHESVALNSKEVISEMLFFCENYFPKDTLIPLAGHNTQFDVSFLKVFLSNNGRSFSRIFSHRIIDTYTLIRSLYYANIIKYDISSSAKAFKYFNIKVNGRHTALGDALATVELYNNLLKLLK